MFRGEMIISAVIFVGSLYLYFESIKFEGHAVYGELGPAYWPKFLLICMMVLSFWVAIDAIRERRKRKPEEVEISKPHSGKTRFFLAVSFIVLYLILLKLVGFIAITPIFLFSFMYLLGERKKIWMIIVPIGMTILIVYAFTKVMYVPLPRGTGLFLKFSQFFY